MEFTKSFISVLNNLPISEAINRVRSSATLEDADPDQAEREYREIRGEKVVLAPEDAAQMLNGQSISGPTELLVPVLESGGRVELAMSQGKVVFRATPPVHQRQRYIFTHKGKEIEGPLVRFVRQHYPKSRAVEILENPGKSDKTVVGAWEAIQRDPQIKKHFSRRKKRTKTGAHQRALVRAG